LKKNILHLLISTIMKNIFLWLAISSVLFVACSKTEQPDYESLLKGVWINTVVDQQQVETDNVFVMEFAGDKEYYSAGMKISDSSKKWFDRQVYDFETEGKLIKIAGKDNSGNDMAMEFEIRTIDSLNLSYKVNSFKVNGTEYPDDKIYVCKKANQNLNESFVGTWYGISEYEGSTDLDYHYWDYFANGSYDYYYRQSPTADWIRKSDNEGKYYLHDNLLATNWTNDLISGSTGLAYECWYIEMTGNTMRWTAYRANGLVARYRMEKVSGPPTAN